MGALRLYLDYRVHGECSLVRLAALPWYRLESVTALMHSDLQNPNDVLIGRRLGVCPVVNLVDVSPQVTKRPRLPIVQCRWNVEADGHHRLNRVPE